MVLSLRFRQRHTCRVAAVHLRSFVAVRCFSSAPDRDEEVRAAYRILGIPPCTHSLAEVRKKYVDLAKIHHPDVTTTSSDDHTGGGPTSRMTEINSAYGIVTQFLKSGRRLDQQADSSRHAGFRAEEWRDPDYAPFYEAMWSQMHDEGAAFHNVNFSKANTKKKFYSDSGRRKTSTESRQEPKKDKRDRGGGSQWSEADRTALQHMYEDGRSFDFIANALQKKTSEVVEEFNEWRNELRGAKNHRNWDMFSSMPGSAYRSSSRQKRRNSSMQHDAEEDEDLYYYVVQDDDYGYGEDGYYNDPEGMSDEQEDWEAVFTSGSRDWRGGSAATSNIPFRNAHISSQPGLRSKSSKRKKHTHRTGPANASGQDPRSRRYSPNEK